MTNPTDTTVRMTDRLSIAVDEISSTEKYSSKKTFVQSALSENVFSLHSKIEGHKALKDFAVKLNSDVTWFNLDIKGTCLTAKLSVDSDLTSVVKVNIGNPIQDVINSIVNSTNLSQSDVIRICVICHCYNHRSKFDTATQMEVKDRWLSIKAKLKHMVEKLVVNLYFELEPERLIMKINSKYEQRNVHHIRCHYKQLKKSEAHKVMQKTHYGKKVTNTLEKVLS